MEPMSVGPNLRHRVQLRSFNPTMFTIFDTTNHHRASLTSRTPALVAQDIVRHEFRSSRVAAGGRPLIIEEPPPLHNGRKQYLSSKQQQQQHHNQWKAPFKSRSCWCKLCFDSRQNSINHESLLAPPPLVNDREKARPIISAIDNNGNDVNTTAKAIMYASAAPACAVCHEHQEHVARKNLFSEESSERRFELSPVEHETTDSSSAAQRRLLRMNAQTQYDRTNDVKSGTAQQLLPSSSLGSASVPSAKMNNLPSVSKEVEGESGISVGARDGPKNNKRFRRNQVKRGRRVKVCPLKLVGLFPKNVLEKIIPAEKIGQEMELRLTWPTATTTTTTTTTAKPPQSSSGIVFRISSATTKPEENRGGEDKTTETTDKSWNLGGYHRRRRRRPELNVMDCALQLFNSRNCNDFLYFTIQRQLGASSGNRYNVSLHEFPRGSIGTQNSSARHGLPRPPSTPRHLFKQSSSSSLWQEYSETAEKELRILCSDCRANKTPFRIQTECLGCNKRFEGLRRRCRRRRDESFFDDAQSETHLVSMKRKALVDLRRVLIEFNVHLQARSIFFFDRMVSRVTEVNHFVNLFNIDVVQSGSIRFRLRVLEGAHIFVQLLCSSSNNSGKCFSKLYQMRFKLDATNPSSAAKFFGLVAFDIVKYEDKEGEEDFAEDVKGTSLLLLPELLVRRF